MLYRAHVPILNVKYTADACGPYRDWQYQEGMIQAQGIRRRAGIPVQLRARAHDHGHRIGHG